MIPEQHDDGVARVRTLVERVEQAADVHVGVGARRQVSLHRRQPAPALQHLAVVVQRLRHGDPGGGHIVQVV